MSVNWAMLSGPGGDPVPLPGEQPPFFQQHGVKATLDCSENGYSGTLSGCYWEGKGTVFISNQRITFVVRPPSATFQSLNIPIGSFKNWQLEQPWFAANYVAGTVIPTPGGGLSRPGRLKLTFYEGGAIEFTNIYRTILERLEQTNEIPQHLEELPPYEEAS